MKIEKFEDINAWQKSKVLTLLVYKTFSNQKDYGFKDQIQRAAVSVMNNIAEGFERRGDKEFKHFRISKFASWTKNSLFVRRSAVNAILRARVKIYIKVRIRGALYDSGRSIQNDRWVDESIELLTLRLLTFGLIYHA